MIPFLLNSSTSKSVYWKSCSLRKWLSGTFYTDAFSEEEKKKFVETPVDNSRSQDDTRYKYAGEDAPDTTDKVFILSFQEAMLYFNNDRSRAAEMTKYAVATKKTTSKEYGGWWLRSPGITRKFAMTVSSKGSLTDTEGEGTDVASKKFGVRPVLWYKFR